jgi:hypothetical protein
MSVVTRATAKTYFETNDTPTQAQFENTLDSTLFAGEQDLTLLAMQALGSVALAQTLGGGGPGWISSLGALADGTMNFVPVYLPKDATVTGVKFYQNTQGNFTGNNTNSISLYSYSGGTLTKVAESANDENIWKAASGSWQTTPFASTYAAAAGIYFVGLLYNNSAQTTAPSIGKLADNLGGNSVIADFTNSAKLHCINPTENTAAATYTMASNTTSGIRYYVMIY